MKKINNMSTPNQMRIFMGIMRGKSNQITENKTVKRNVSMRDLLKITRNINEQEEMVNSATEIDNKNEQQKFKNIFNDMNVSVNFIPLEIYDNLIFWGGTIDGVLQFTYKVSPDEANSGVDFNYLPDFTQDNPDNQKIVEKVENYYDTFYRYWRDNK